MKCPICPDSNLLIAERQGVEIDYCPQCRGVWLDRGELDKLIERSTTSAPVAPIQHDVYSQHGHPRKEEHHSYHRGGYGDEHRRKKSWLAEIFD